MTQDKRDVLWPLIPEAPGVTKSERRVMTGAAALFIALPFLLVVAGLALALWLANLTETTLAQEIGLSVRWSIVAADTFKFTSLFVAGRMLWLMVPFVPELIRRARVAVAEAAR